MTTFSLKSLYRLGSLLVGLASTTQAADDVWAKYASENFVLYTASSQGKAETVLQHLERVRAAYALMLDAKLGDEDPVNVLLFKSQKEYLDYASIKTSAAYYTQALGRDFIVISDFNAHVEQVLNHEYFHLYARSKGFEWPTWANEGFADYFSTLKFGDKTLDVGYPIANHMRYLNSTGRKLNAESLFAMDPTQRTEAGQQEVSDLYAMSWTLAHFIMSDAEMLPRRDQMIRALQKHENSAAAFQEVYGWDLKRVDDQLRGYIQRSSMNYTRISVEKDQVTFDAPVSVAELKEWEAPLLLADVQANARKFDEAEKEYLRLSELYPDVPNVDDSRAALFMSKGERESAAPVFRAAVSKGSTNPMTYQFLAFSDCSRSTTPECLDLTNKAIELAPDVKELKFLRINLLNQAEQFVPALLLANKVAKVTAGEAPRFFYLVAYAHYRLNQTDEAKKAIETALRHAVAPDDLFRVQQLKAAIEQPQMTMVAVPVTDSGPPVLSRPRTEPREEGLGDGSPNSAGEAESVAQRVVNRVTAGGATLTEAQLKDLDCSSAAPVLTVETEAGTMKIQIDNPSFVQIIRDGIVAEDYQFTCGAQSGETIRVGYSSSADGAPGVFLRLLQFGEI